MLHYVRGAERGGEDQLGYCLKLVYACLKLVGKLV